VTRRNAILFAAAAFAMAIGFAVHAAASTVSGRVVYRDGGRPIPGMTVYLVHPKAGRSLPAATDSQGRFQVENVPARPDPYYLEVYWGTNLKYRKRVMVSGAGVSVPDIVL
jgi:carboxypeptidase family protein